MWWSKENLPRLVMRRCARPRNPLVSMHTFRFLGLQRLSCLVRLASPALATIFRRVFASTVVLTTLASCGFALRGSYELPYNTSPVTSRSNSVVAGLVRRDLADSKTKVVGTAKDAEAARWLAWTRQEAYRQLAPAPLMEPLRRLRGTKRPGWCRRARETLNKVVTDGGCAQRRLCEVGLVTDGTCLACQKEIGSLHHRYFGCHTTWEERRKLPSRTWQHDAEGQAEWLLWTRCLVKDPAASWEPLPCQEEVRWKLGEGQDALF